MGWIFGSGRKTGREIEKHTADGEAITTALRPVNRPRAESARKAVSTFPRFQSTASDEMDGRSNDKMSAARLKLRKTYTPAQPMGDRGLFAGRRDLLSTVIRAIEDTRVHTIIYGQRGIGKTSLLHVVADAAREARYLVVYVSCGATGSFDETFRAIASEIPLRFHAAYGPKAAEAEAGGVFGQLLPSEPISPRLASEICGKVIGTRVLVIVDEFDRCGSLDFRRDIAEFLKNLSDRSVRVQLVIAGVAENFDDLLESGVLIQRNVIGLEVSRMSVEEARDLLRMGQEFSGVEFEENAIELLVAAANGLPYIISLLAQHAGLAALTQGRMSVSRADVLTAVDNALAEMKGRIPRRSWAQLSRVMAEGADNLLGPLAAVAKAENGRFSSEDIKTASLGPLEMARAQALVDRLAREGGLIVREGDETVGQYRFLDQNVLPYLWLKAVRGAFADRAEVRGSQREPADKGTAAV